MYNLPHFKENDGAAVLDFMKQHPFAMLIGSDTGHAPVVTQIPFLFKEKEGCLYLYGHIMKQTDHHKAFETNDQALVVFTGPHAYVSASWYNTPQQASTWNYMAVHAKGTLRFLDEKRLLELLDELTSHFENDPSSPALYKELSADYVTKMVKAIIAFEIKVTAIDHVFKLSQNRDTKSFDHIVEKLSQGNADGKAIAAEMIKRRQSP